MNTPEKGLKSNAIKLRINYDEEKLTELAQKRRASRVQHMQQPEKFSFTNQAYNSQSPTRLSVVELKEFENKVYEVPEFSLNGEIDVDNMSVASTSTQKSKLDMLQADDECLKIDIELLETRKPINLKQSSSLASLQTTRQRASRDSFSSIKNIFQGPFNSNTDKYDNDLYGLVEDTDDTQENNRDTDEMLTIVERPSKKRRKTEFEIFVPVPSSANQENCLFTKI